jgi:hypothetical protein
LHDTIKLESFGIRAVPVATHEFMSAGRAQAAALGRPDFDAVYIPHPIQDQTRAEIETKADAVVEELVTRLTAQTPTSTPRP